MTIEKIATNGTSNAIVVPDFSKMSLAELTAWTKAADEQKAARKEAEKKAKDAAKVAAQALKEKEKAQESLFFTHAKTTIEVNIRAKNDELLKDGSKWVKLNEDDVKEVYKLVRAYFEGKAKQK